MPGREETVSAQQALTLIRGGACGLDVRSEGEFVEGAIPGFSNVPILNNEHRHLVGLKYKQAGQEEAIKIGHQLVDPLRTELIKAWREALVNGSERVVTCWRGGLRSKMASEWIRESGLSVKRVEGGYKAMRGVLRQELERELELVVLTGMTGIGKTELLWELNQNYVIDLEGMAKHRGSAFGGFTHDPQPSQQNFENRLAMKSFGAAGPFVCEAESRMVGSCVLPEKLKARMALGERVILESSLQERARRIHKEYVLEALAQDSSEDSWQNLFQKLSGSLAKVQRRLGGLRYQAIFLQLQKPFLLRQKELVHHEEWIISLLSDYYDPLYAHAANRSQGKIAFKGHWQECYEYLTSCIVGWRARSRSGS